MCLVDCDKDGKGGHPQRTVEGNGLEVALGNDQSFLSLTHISLMSQDLLLSVRCLCQQHQHHPGTPRRANSWPHPGPTWVEVQKSEF